MMPSSITPQPMKMAEEYRVRHRRPAFQHHPEHQAEGVNQPSQDDEVKGRAAERFRQVGRHGERQDRAARQHEREEVDDRRVQEGLHIVVVEFGLAFRQLPLETRLQPLPGSQPPHG